MPIDQTGPQWRDYEENSSERKRNEDHDNLTRDKETLAEIAGLRKDAEMQRVHSRNILKTHKACEEEWTQIHQAETTAAANALVKQELLTKSIIPHRPKHKPVHDIALRLIFEALFPLEGFLYPEILLGPDSPWSRALRMRKAITLVCRQWHEVGYPFLYRDIVLRRVGQAAALHRTFQDAPGYGTQVQALTLLFLVPPNMVQFAATTLPNIIDSCPSLRSLVLGPVLLSSLDCSKCVQSPPFDLTVGFYVAAARRVQKLEYSWKPDSDPCHSPIMSRIEGFSNLTHLTICVPAADSVTPSAHFDSLQVLALSNVTRHQDLRTLCSWQLPKLDQLHFRPSIDSSRTPRSFVEFVAKQTSLSLLDIGYSPSCLLDGRPDLSLYDCLHLALVACPSIRRLVVPASDGGSDHILDSSLNQTQLEHVDVWAPIHDLRLPCVMHSLPWRNVRLLDYGLSTVTELPHLLPPWTLAPPEDPTREVYVHDIFGMRLVETARSIVRHDQPWPHALGEGNIDGVEHGDFQWDVRPDDNEHDDGEQGGDNDWSSASDSNLEFVLSDEWSEGEDSEESSDSEVPLHDTTYAEVLDIFTAQLDDDWE